ncbi:MAG: hypothetical protein WC495_06665, partial [Patescibacteria group bacterium]
ELSFMEKAKILNQYVMNHSKEVNDFINMEELKSGDDVPLQYDEIKMKDMGDVTSMWNSFKGFVRKR